MSHYWKTILEEVRYYEQKGYHCRYSNLQETDIFNENRDDTTSSAQPSSVKITYPLPAPFDHLYLTEREAECVFCLLQHHTIKSTSILLNLSARTVEFYLKNIKTKLKIRTKSALITQLQHINFGDFTEVHDTLLQLIQSQTHPAKQTTAQKPLLLR